MSVLYIHILIHILTRLNTSITQCYRFSTIKISLIPYININKNKIIIALLFNVIYHNIHKDRVILYHPVHDAYGNIYRGQLIEEPTYRGANI